MSLSHRDRSADFAMKPRLPWQLVVVSVVLGLEGVGNFLSMFDRPIAAVWLAAKVLFITGFLKRWKPVFWLYVVVGALHVLEFGLAGHFGIALINLILVGLTVSQADWFTKAEKHDDVSATQFVEDGNPYRVSQP